MKTIKIWERIYVFFKANLKRILINLWYIVLVAAGFVFVFKHYDQIISSSAVNATSFIAIIWIVLLLLPLFSEFEFFGVKLKKEIQNVSAEVKDAALEIKEQIVELRINNSNTANYYFTQGALPDRNVLENLNKDAEKFKVSDIGVSTEIPKNDVPEDSTNLFKTRFGLERFLSELCRKTGYDEVPSIPRMLQFLTRHELLDVEIINLIREVYRIASRGIHGEIIDKEYIDFVNNSYPVIETHIVNTIADLKSVSCPRCGFSGYSKHFNTCPKCGRTFGEY